MDLSDALGGWPPNNNQSGGNQGPWPGQSGHPAWPEQPSGHPAWGGGSSGGEGQGLWPGAGTPGGGGVFPSPQPSAPGPVPGFGPGPSPGPGPASGIWGGPASGPGPAPGPAPGPGMWPGAGPGPAPAPQPHIPAAPQRSLAIPYNHPLPGGLYDKMLITINGVVKHNPNKITVDLSTTKDLAFHFNPRFNEGGHKVIVRNSRISNSWGREERDLRQFPFVAGQPFELKIMVTSREFKVAVNNSHLLEFKHRVTDLRAITSLSIYNDVTLSRVNVERLP